MGDIIQELEEKFQYHFERARSFLKEEDFISAREEVEKALEVKPGDDRALNLLGMIYFKIEDYEKAVKIFRQLLRRNPNINTLRINLGLAYLKLEEYEEAAQILKEAVVLDEQNEKAHNYLGYALYNLGRLEEALEEFKKGKAEKMVKKVEAELKGETETKIEEKPEAVEELPSPETPVQEVEAPEKEAGKEEPAEEEPIKEEPFIKNFRPLADEVETSQPAVEEKGEEELPPPESVSAETAEEGAEQSAVPSDEKEEITSEKAEVPPESAGEEAGQPAEEKKIEETGEEVQPEKEAAAEVEKAAEEKEEETTPAKQPTVESETEEKSVEVSEEEEEEEEEKETEAPDYRHTEIKKVHSFKNGNLIIKLVDERFYIRSKDVLLVKGDVNFKDIKKKYRGEELQTIFGTPEDPMSLISGMGHVSVETAEEKEPFEIEVRGEPLFLIEKYILGFSDTLDYENGKLKGEKTQLYMVKFTEYGYVLLRVPRESVIRVETTAPDESMLVPLERIIGWKGSFTPTIPDSKKAFLSLRGEGYVYLKR